MQPVVNYDHKTIQVRRGSTTEWRRYGAICVPAEGEICVEFFQDADGTRNGNTGMKVGNGTSNYTDLPYLVTNQSQDDRISDEQINNWDLTVEKLANLTAAEIAQDNASLGDNVQEALNDLNTRLLAIDPDGGSIEINDITGLEDALNNKADKDHTHDEYLTDAPNDGNQYVRQSQAWAEVAIPDGGAPAWDDVTGKPTEFPPAAHNQDWSTITNAPSDYPPSAHDHAWDDVTGKPTEFPPEAHTHEQSEVDGLELRLESIEGSISSGGGFVDAPNDGQLYGRQSEAWAVVPSGGASSWDDLTDKPTDFPPAAHNQGWDTITDKPDDYPPSAHGHAWDEITGKPTEFPPASHNHDGVYQPVGDYIEDANSDGKQYARQDGDWSEIVIPDGGAGSSVHIGEAPPADPQEGQQWMEVPASGEAIMWIYDGAKWLQQPGGKDGADGVDGVDGLWTDNGDTSISYNGGNVGIGTDSPASVVTSASTCLVVSADSDNSASTSFQTANAQWEIGSFENVGGKFGVFNNATASFPLTIGADGHTRFFDDVSAAKPDAGAGALALGAQAGQKSQGEYGVSIGYNAGTDTQAAGAVAIGGAAGYVTQGAQAVAVGSSAGENNQGAESVAIGKAAGQTNQAANGIIISSSGAAVNSNSVGHIIIKSSTQDLRSLPSGGFSMNGDPIIGTRRLISTLSTLRNATKDETTLEGVRDALSDAIGGLIENLEHEIATQEISDE